ncbi:hypothetical protein [Nitrososphaera viennensis]|uniref:Uncharacterized protein n=2 Tax=Nitrososphaera viennensis TaxID=1034015 RepID=A0A060HPT3_9ARCH|nr:hypothetical protein [Nitrososphaera viennensis]AIC17145.1 hypothetical protein NVIE_028700 [Nitrososphaera viennensis EN76]UVS69036.1 hypothetical protein NWT39_14160 [Nitrososphaera viennensis]
MSKETRNPAKRDQALNDATEGQFGEEPRPEVRPNVEKKKDQSRNTAKDIQERANREKRYAM